MEQTQEIQTVSILGSSGSIGQTTLEFIRQHRDKYKLVALATGTNQNQLI